LKGLRKVVSDTSEPLGPGAMDENTFLSKHEADVEIVFLRFFVKLFRNYKKYVEAPSEEVVEKFKKEEFLAEHPDRCEWLREVMETQMFQCFVDERYEFSNKTDNLEVLFFDEWIDKLEQKQSPFLSDTSQDHRPDSVEDTMSPNTAGLDEGKKYKYITFPKLDPNLMLPVRKPKKLVTEAEETRDNDRRIDMSKMAMKFFKEKRLYSQHFHSLSLHSRKQNIYFNSLVHYLKSAQAHEEKFAKAQLSLYHNTMGSFKSYPTSTSIDDVWNALKNHIRLIAEREIAGVRQVGSKCCQDLYTTAFQMENSISLLLTEAERLEKKTGKGKNRLENAKANAYSTKAAWKKLRNAMQDGSPLLSQAQIARIVAAQNSMEDASLGKVEAATSFRTVLAAYEARMPKIVKSIRRDNIKRIEQYKTSMQEYLKVKRQALEGALKTLANIEEKVSKIDTKGDMQLFMQGTNDFWGDVKGGDESKLNIGDMEDLKSLSSHSPAAPFSAAMSQVRGSLDSKRPLPTPGNNTLGVPPDLPYDSSSGMEGMDSPKFLPDHLAPPPPPPENPSPRNRSASEARSNQVPPPPLPPKSRSFSVANDHAREEPIRGLPPLDVDGSQPPQGRPPPLPTSPKVGPPPLPAKVSEAAASPPRKRAPMHPRGPSHGSIDLGAVPPPPPPKMHSRNSSRSHSRHTRSALMGRTLPTTPMGFQGDTSCVKHALGMSPIATRPKSYSLATGRPAGVITASADWNTLGALTYTVNMWGDNGFHDAMKQAIHSKGAVKRFTAMLEEWSAIISQVGKRFETVWKAFPAQVPQETSMLGLWHSYRELSKSKVYEYLNGNLDGKSEGKEVGLANKVTGLAQGLRLSKGMIKKSMARYTDLRSRLMKEVEEAKTRRDGAESELKGAEAKYALVCTEQERTEKEENASQITLDRIWQKVDQAKKVKQKREHQLLFYENELIAIRRKHDFVFARMQSLFEMKERECQCKLKHTLKFLVAQIERMMQGLRKCTLKMHDSALSLAFQDDLKEFLSGSAASRSGSNKRGELNAYSISENQEPKLSAALGLKGFAKATTHAHRNIGVIKTMETAIEAAAEAQEAETKLMRKWFSQYARRSSTGVIFTVHDGHSLAPAFNSLARTIEEMIKFWQGMHELYMRFNDGLRTLRGELKLQVKFQQKQYETELKRHDVARQERDRAERELKKAKGEQEAAVDRHGAAQKAADKGEVVRKKNLFRWGKEDVHKLKSKMDQKIKEFNKCGDMLKRKKEGLDHATVVLEQRIKKCLDEMQASEKKRFDTVQSLAKAFTEEQAKRISHLIDVLRETYHMAEKCDLHDNIQRFLKKHKASEQPPDYVQEDYERSFGYYFHAEPETPDNIREMMWL